MAITPTERTTTMAVISGNTYPVRDQLKALGGRWDSTRKAWIVPDSRADLARALVPVGSNKPRASRGPRTCKTCGCKINYGVYCGKCEYR
jgi:hypothetical protein